MGLTTERRSQARLIGRWGTMARLAVGVAALTFAVMGGVTWVDASLGLIALPSVFAIALRLRGRGAVPLRLDGPIAHGANLGVGFLLFSFLPVAALLFYGTSMLLAAYRGFADCEVFAFSNWLWGRDDRIGCPLFAPIDVYEAARAERERPC